MRQSESTIRTAMRSGEGAGTDSKRSKSEQMIATYTVQVRAEGESEEAELRWLWSRRHRGAFFIKKSGEKANGDDSYQNQPVIKAMQRKQAKANVAAKRKAENKGKEKGERKRRNDRERAADSHSGAVTTETQPLNPSVIKAMAEKAANAKSVQRRRPKTRGKQKR
ncbi:MAG: hypothetical protein ACLTXL_09445 [Clostridia bacterium]